MEVDTFKTMLLCEEVLVSRNLLNAMRAADFPSMKSDERGKLHKSIHKIAFPNVKQKTIALDDIERLFNG